MLNRPAHHSKGLRPHAGSPKGFALLSTAVQRRTNLHPAFLSHTFANSILKAPCYIEAKAPGSGLNGAPFQGASP